MSKNVQSLRALGFATAILVYIYTDVSIYTVLCSLVSLTARRVWFSMGEYDPQLAGVASVCIVGSEVVGRSPLCELCTMLLGEPPRMCCMHDGIGSADKNID